MKFRVSLDKTSRIITVLILLLFAGITLLGLIPSHQLLGVVFFPSMLLWLIAIGCFGLSPRYYMVFSDRVIIKRYWGSVVIPRSEIRLCRTLTKPEIGSLMRYFGVGGFFGYFGNFISSKLGNLKLYATQQENYVMLHTTSNRRIMLTPDEPVAFTRSVTG